MRRAYLLFMMATIAAIFAVIAPAVEITNIDISQKKNGDITIALAGDDIINFIDRVYLKPVRIVIRIADGSTKHEYGQYNVSRGNITSLSIAKSDKDMLDIIIYLTNTTSFLIESFNNSLELKIRAPNNTIITPWSITQLADIDINSKKYSSNDTMKAAWTYTGPRDSVNYRYRINGPKYWLGDSSLQNNMWTNWYPGKQGIFEHGVYETEGKYELTVQFGSGNDTCAERSVQFKIGD